MKKREWKAIAMEHRARIERMGLQFGLVGYYPEEVERRVRSTVEANRELRARLPPPPPSSSTCLIDMIRVSDNGSVMSRVLSENEQTCDSAGGERHIKGWVPKVCFAPPLAGWKRYQPPGSYIIWQTPEWHHVGTCNAIGCDWQETCIDWMGVPVPLHGKSDEQPAPCEGQVEPTIVVEECDKEPAIATDTNPCSGAKPGRLHSPWLHHMAGGPRNAECNPSHGGEP